MSDLGNSYKAQMYDVPNIVRSMGNMMRGPRGHYSTNFTDVFSSNKEEQYNYVNGILAVLISFVVIFLFWVFVLFVLKFRGAEVGCASGRPFLTKGDEDDLQSTDDDEDSFLSSIGSASQSSSQGENSVAKLIDAKAKKTSSNDSLEGSSHGKNGPPTDAMTTHDEDDPSIQAHANNLRFSRASQRERRTRFCFLVVSLLSLVCVPVILVTSFGPLKEVSRTTDELTVLTREILIQANATMDSIEAAIKSATEVVGNVSMDMGTICPNVNKDNFEETLGIDLNELVVSVTEEYNSMVTASEEKIQFVRNFVQSFDDGLMSFENTVAVAEEWLWMAPAVLFAVSLSTAAAMLGVVLAWRGKSSAKVQNTMSYVVLPLLMVSAIATWIILLFAAMATMVGSDACTASTSKGSLDETIQQILGVLNLEANSTTFEIVQAYTSSCSGPDPMQDIEQVQVEVQEIMDKIWQYISRVDSIGRAQIMDICGGDDLEGLLLAARNVAKILTSIRRALDSTRLSLSCPRINVIYVAAAHDAVCTDAASAVAGGFLVLLILGMSLLTMMSLRASWLQNIKEEKVYHDESEVAENMILDEHEEYLAYISKYKHEWQEYGGFDGQAMEPSAESEQGSFSEPSEGSLYFDEEEDNRSEMEGYSGSMTESEGYSTATPASGPTGPRKMPSRLLTAESSDQISLPSLTIQESTASASIVADDLFKGEPRVLPPPANPEYQQEENYIADAVQAILSKKPSMSSLNEAHKIKRESSKSSNADARSALSRQSSKSSPDASRSAPSRESRLTRQSSKSSTKSGPQSGKPDPSGKETQPSRFFERYGIDPGASVRKKADTHMFPPSLGANPPPPPPPPPPPSRAHSAKTFQRPDAPTRQSAQAQSLPRTNSLRSKTSQSPGRPFFKATPTGNLGEIELQWPIMACSPRCSANMHNDVFEC